MGIAYFFSTMEPERVMVAEPVFALDWWRLVFSAWGR